MLSLQASLAHNQAQNQELEKKVKDLETQQSLIQDLDMEPDGQFYIRTSERAASKHIPYCPQCWGADRKLVPLLKGSPIGTWQCRLHSTLFKTLEHERWLAKENAENEAAMSVAKTKSISGPTSWMG